MNHRKWKPRYSGQAKEERRAPYLDLTLRAAANALLMGMQSDPPMFIDTISAKKRVITLRVGMCGACQSTIEAAGNPNAGDTVTVGERIYEFDGKKWGAI